MENKTKMTPELQRIAIAEACGWTECHPATKTPHGFFEAYGRKKLPCGSRKDERLPDYLNDLNAMHEAEKVLNYEQAEEFVEQLYLADQKNNLAENPHPWRFSVASATAAQRAEAFLRTLEKWQGE